MKPRVIFEDENLLVLDKPFGWVVNEAGTTGSTPVVQTWLKENFDYSLAGSRDERSGIVHRLDKDTSGILIVAKNLDSFRNLQLQFEERKVKKKYIALAHGRIDQKAGEVKVPVGRLPWNRERFGVLPGGRDSQTSFKVIAHYKKDSNYYTLVELEPRTGRTHQIRIHLKYLGYPIVADSFYAGRKTARKDRDFCPRLFLHAKEITFLHPVSGKNVRIRSELPDDLNKTLDLLEKLP